MDAVNFATWLTQKNTNDMNNFLASEDARMFKGIQAGSSMVKGGSMSGSSDESLYKMAMLLNSMLGQSGQSGGSNFSNFSGGIGLVGGR